MEQKPELSVLQEQLLDEYFRCKRALHVKESEVKENGIKGYLSYKTINGRSYCYYQWRDGKTIKSKYLPGDMVPDAEAVIARQKNMVKSIRRLKRDIQTLEKVLGKELIEVYEPEYRSVL